MNSRSLPVKRECDFQFPFPFPGAKKPFPLTPDTTHFFFTWEYLSIRPKGAQFSNSGERTMDKYISILFIHSGSGIELLSYSSITIPIHGTLLHPVSRANCPHGTGIKLLGNSCVGNLALFHCCCCHCCQRQSTFACLLLSQLKLHWLARLLHDLGNFGGKMITFKCTRPGPRAVLVKLFLKS